ncbi:MAG: hypothetical protein NTU97_03045 [Candidatus Magasanikbacteria bacterium]|nr:hypothetical protein [Candidatus Magasanikbacteria bacterium]
MSPTTLTFTTANWNTPQTVTITATADTGVEGTETGTITHTATSVDGYYNGISIGGVTVTITDNDVAASGGGGGSSVSGVYNPILSINNGATSTSNNLVTLTLGASGASEMIISENFGFLGASWEPVTSSKSWPLSSATGTKNIYVRYRDSYNNFSSTVSSAIVLLGSTSFISTTPSLLPTPLVPIIIPVIKTPVVVETPLIVLNPESKIVISNINSLSLQPATSLMFNYSYTNDTEQMRKVRLVRQVLNAKGTIIASTQAYRNIKAGDEVSIDVKQLIGRYWTPGEFIERVRVFDSQGKMIEENSFPFVVEKFKYKYLIKGELGFDNSIVFDPTVWAKNKIEVRTPFQLRIRFSYTNQTEVKQDVRMLREIVDATGMIISTLRGRWSMNPAETYGITVNQNIPTTLLPGEYAVRIRALDYKTGDLLAENSAGFTIELK